MTKPVIFWFRNDLRLHDNPALQRAIESGHPIVPVFVFDNKWKTINDLGFPYMGEHRQKFLHDSLNALSKLIKQSGNELLVLEGKTVDVLAKLAKAIDASAIYASKEYAFDEISLEQELEKKVSLKLFSSNMLFPPELVPFPPETSPFYYTRFKNKVLELGGLVKTESAITNIPESDEAIYSDFNVLKLEKSIENIPFSGGESAATERFEDWMNADGLNQYINTRNLFQGENFSSHLAPWLANGSLSVRWVWETVNAYAKKHNVNEESLTTFREQLIWRDYFRYIIMRYGSKLFWVKGLRTSDHGMYNDRETFQNWCNGTTGQPIVDALMRELKHTGFMSNRGRMLVSYYLAKELKVNWQWGAAWFESQLIDYDVYSNYGNWAYQSGRGTDSRVNRRFNLQKQAEKFDPDDSFRKKWLE